MLSERVAPVEGRFNPAPAEAGHPATAKAGVPLSRKRVYRLMREKGLFAKNGRIYRSRHVNRVERCVAAPPTAPRCMEPTPTLKRAALASALVLGCSSGETSGVPPSQRDSRVLLVEFDGIAPNGIWDAHELAGGFDYDVTPTALVMYDRSGENQHLVRRGVAVDPERPYVIEARFTIAASEDATPLNSFCLNLNVAGPDGELSPPSTWALNVDLAPGAQGGVMKYMGFVDGAFQQLGERPIAWGVRGTEYLFRVGVNVDASGQPREKRVTASVLENDLVLEHFDVDYSPFAYQPSAGTPVRIGLNTHGTDWTLRDLRVEFID